MKRRNFLGGAAALIPALASGSISPRADSATLDSNNRIVSTNGPRENSGRLAVQETSAAPRCGGGDAV